MGCQLLAPLRQEPRLAHAGLAHDPHHLPPAAFDLGQHRLQAGQLARTPQQRRAGPMADLRTRGLTRQEAYHLVREERIGRPSSGGQRARLHLHPPIGQPRHRGGYQEFPWRRVPKEPHRQSHRFPHREPAPWGLVGPVRDQQRPQMPCQPDHRAGLPACGGLRLSGHVADRQRRLNRALRQLLQGPGQPKGHEAQRRRTLEDDAAESRDPLGDAVLPAAREGPGLVGPGVGFRPLRPGRLDREHRHGLRLPAHSRRW
jgi:hypothetical protein